MHGTTAIPKIGVQAACSQNLAKKTVTVIKKWQEGNEKNQHIQYRLNQLNQDPIAQAALVTSIEKNREKKENEIVLNDINYEGNLVNLENNTFNWI